MWQWLRKRMPSRQGLAVKLAASLMVSLTLLFTVLAYLNWRWQRRQAEELVLQAAERVSNVVRRSTRDQMLRNDREALARLVQELGQEPGIRRIRIMDESGGVRFSTDATEVGQQMDQHAPSCIRCHEQPKAQTRLERRERVRIFDENGGARVLGVIHAIENEPACSNAACHAHPAERRILGVIDTDLSLAAADAQIAGQQRQALSFTLLALLLVSLTSVGFIWRVVHKPISQLTTGTRRVAQGELDFRIPVHSRDELGVLAESFNTMTAELAAARQELTGWARTLEDRVEAKTRELTRAHEQMLQSEKMASIGKLAAVVAHEINNPLAGILTYTKLLRKWLEGGAWESHAEQARSSLELIESESRRCGEIVRNLLMFARAAPLHLEATSIAGVVERVVRLVRHKMELSGIEVHLAVPDGLPLVECDPSGIEQVLLALVMNAVEAMPRGGNLWIEARAPNGEWLELDVRDDGLGMTQEVLEHIFDPFFTTKERGHGVGLGLAVTRTLVDRHQGKIEVQSEPGRGSRFTVRLPWHAKAAAPPETAAATPQAR